MLTDGETELVSVVIPAFNAEQTLAATLESVRAQTYPALEIIVVDDGSSDGTAALVERIALQDARIRLFRQDNKGVAAARNAAIAAARGTLIAPIDADDLWHPRKLELQAQVFSKSTVPLGFVYAWSRRIDDRGCATADQGEPRFEGKVFAQLLAYNFLNNASVALFRKRSIVEAGGFDTSLQWNGAHGAEDLALALAIAEREPIGLVPCYLVGYRQVPGAMSADGSRMRRSMELVLSAIEQKRSDLPARLFRTARMHADLYASGLALNERDWAVFARLLVRGFTHAPRGAARLFFCAALWRLREALGIGGAQAAFLDLNRHERLPILPLQGWLEGKRAASVRAIVASHARGRSQRDVVGVW